MKFKRTSKFRDEGNLRAIKLRAIKIDCTYRRVDTGIPAEISTSATSSSSSGQRTSGQAAPSPPLYMCTTTPSLFIVGLSPSGSCCHLSSGHQERSAVPFIGKDEKSSCSRESYYHWEFNRKNDYTHDNRCNVAMIIFFVKLPTSPDSDEGRQGTIPKPINIISKTKAK